MAFGKFIFECDEDNIIHAMRAAKNLISRAGERECFVCFGEQRVEVEMFARRLKRSISVKQVKP